VEAAKNWGAESRGGKRKAMKVFVQNSDGGGGKERVPESKKGYDIRISLLPGNAEMFDEKIAVHILGK